MSQALSSWEDPGRIDTAAVAAIVTTDDAEVEAHMTHLCATAADNRRRAIAAAAPDGLAIVVDAIVYQWKLREILRRDHGYIRTDDEIAEWFVNCAASLTEFANSTTGLSLLTKVVESIPRNWDERRHGILSSTVAHKCGGTRPLVHVTGDSRQLGSERFLAEPVLMDLPGIEPVQPSPVPVLPFVAPYDAAGGASMTQNGGAAHSLRLFVETILAVPMDLRRTSRQPAILICTLRQLAEALWPRGWQRGRDWPRLLAALDELSRLGVEWEQPNGQGGVWYAVMVRSRPRDGALLDDVFRFEVLLPPGSNRGPMIDRTHLRMLGSDSAPAFRLYLSLCWLWDTYGTFRGRLIGATLPEVERDDAGYILDVRGCRVPEKDGTASRRPTHKKAVRTGRRIINSAALTQYPALSRDDLAVMAYPPAALGPHGSSKRRDQRAAASKALDLVAEVTGAELVPPHRSVVGCVRVLPPTTHKAAHDAAFGALRAARRRI